MNANSDKHQLIYKRSIGLKLFLATASMLLLGFKNCVCDSVKTLPRYNFLSEQYPLLKLGAGDGLGSYVSKSDYKQVLGAVRYLKQDHCLGLIELDLPCLSGEKMAVIFCASKSLKDCIMVQLSNQMVTVTYFDGSSGEPIPCIEVDGTLLDTLSKESEPLLYNNNRLRATATCDFKALLALDYGIEMHNAGHISSTSEIKLVQDNKDKTHLQELHHAGFMVTKCTSAPISELVQLVRHLSTNTIQDTDMIWPASICDNRLQPAANAPGSPAYFYIKSGNRYRLVPFSNSAPSIKTYQPYRYKPKLSREQVVVVNAPQVETEAVSCSNCLKKTKQTSDEYDWLKERYPHINDEWIEQDDTSEYSDYAFIDDGFNSSSCELTLGDPNEDDTSYEDFGSSLSFNSSAGDDVNASDVGPDAIKDSTVDVDFNEDNSSEAGVVDIQEKDSINIMTSSIDSGIQSDAEE